MMKIKKKYIKNQKGQSTIEFIISFAIAFSFLFVFLRTALNFTEGYIVQYANYMASRAFLVYERNSNVVGGNDGGASNLAEEVFNRIYPGDFDGDFGVNLATGNPATNVFVGTHASFTQRFSIPMVMGSVGELNMTTESYLGREPSRMDCLTRVCDSFARLGIGGECSGGSMYYTLVDNGC